MPNNYNSIWCLCSTFHPFWCFLEMFKTIFDIVLDMICFMILPLIHTSKLLQLWNELLHCSQSSSFKIHYLERWLGLELKTTFMTDWMVSSFSLTPPRFNLHILWCHFSGCNFMQGLFMELFLSSNHSMITAASQHKIDLGLWQKRFHSRPLMHFTRGAAVIRMQA